MKPSRLLSIVAVFGASLCSAAGVPWPEHPRPDFQRTPWVNLNGEWRFAFDPQDVGSKEEWFKPGKHTLDRTIVVPFPWESRLSGIGDTQYKGAAWYAREVTLPTGGEWDGRDPWLVIGACDWETKVWVNGQPAGEHVGGYTPIEVNLSRHVRPGSTVTITIRAKDLSDPQQPTGKQVNWYTRTSGIWQTVYIEPRGRTCVESLRVLPDLKGGAVTWRIVLNRAEGIRVRVSSPDDAFAPVTYNDRNAIPDIEIRTPLRAPRLWTPDSPTLYRAVIEVFMPDRLTDRVETYFGLREVSVGRAPGRDYQYILLNGKPIYLAGALHQSFHPDGIYHYPDDATMRSDYELCKKIGINMLRIHIKTPIPRELYWADKLGVLIMQDIPNVWHHSKQARAWYEELLVGAVRRDFNHPAIFAWVDFNETWGLNNPGPYDTDRQEWVRKIYERTKQIDPTRLVEDNSPCNYDHVATDINTWHFYINDYEGAKKHIQEVVDKTRPGSTFNYIGGNKQDNDPLMNSEYGGISAGLGDQDISWCFKYLTNELRKHDKICGYIYTELSDIEWEHNGFVNYDRSPKEYGYEFWHPGFSLKDLNNPDFVVIDAPPMVELKTDEKRSIPIAISHWSAREPNDLKLRWALHWPRPDRKAEADNLPWQTRPATWREFAVVQQEPITISEGPGAANVGALLVELLDGDEILARNYINVTTNLERSQVLAIGDRILLNYSPRDYSERTFAKAAPAATTKQGEWVAGEGAGHYQYELELPKDVDIRDVTGLSLHAELASHGVGEKLDWPARRTAHDRPQTDVRKWPTDVRISVNGVELLRATVPDDPADARGALSHHRGQQGGYGSATFASADGEKLERIKKEAGSEGLLCVRFEVPADARHKGGLTIYGAGSGCFGCQPQVQLTCKGKDFGRRTLRAESPAVHRARENVLFAIPDAKAGGHEWQYIVRKPAEDWVSPGFDSNAWRKSRGGFGSRGTPNAVLGRVWNTPEIWLRTEFELEDTGRIASGQWSLYHDEDAEVYLNGVKVLERSGYVTDYIDIPLDAKALGAMKPGRNVVAVYCRNTAGGQNIDLGLTLMLRGGPSRK